MLAAHRTDAFVFSFAFAFPVTPNMINVPLNIAFSQIAFSLITTARAARGLWSFHHVNTI